jgi:hypothetical protein
MEIRFKNGNYIKCIDSDLTVKRGQRAKLHPIDDYMGFKLKWHQKLRLYIYSWWLDTNLGSRISYWTK